MINLEDYNYLIPNNEEYVEYDGYIWHRTCFYYKLIGVPYWECKEHLLHRYIAHKFIRDPKGLIVHHIDENIQNNHPNNLMIVTKAQHNAIHFANKPISKSRSDKLKKSMKGLHNFPKPTSESTKKSVLTRHKQKLQKSPIHDYLTQLVNMNTRLHSLNNEISKPRTILQRIRALYSRWK